ncbi:hypothetical protein CUMW_117210, partial [Citrus unshiu]
EDVVKPLLEVTKTTLLHDCTLLCTWRDYKILGEQASRSYPRPNGYGLTHALTSVWSVNKTDVVNLGSTSGIHNDPEQLLRARVSLVLYLNTKRRSAKSFQRQNNLLFKTQSAPVSLSHIMDASMEDLARCPGIVERKVKCLYDTFHEPFKPVVSRHPPIPETPSLEDVEPSSVNEKWRKTQKNVNKRRKKEPELTVKSALSAAFANYADKMGEKKNSSSQVEETSASNSVAEYNDSGKQDS